MKVAMIGKLMFNKSLYVRRLAVINHIEKTLYVFSIYTSFDGMKSAQMLAITDFHRIIQAMTASVNLTLYNDKFGLQGYYYSKT